MSGKGGGLAVAAVAILAPLKMCVRSGDDFVRLLRGGDDLFSASRYTDDFASSFGSARRSSSSYDDLGRYGGLGLDDSGRFGGFDDSYRAGSAADDLARTDPLEFLLRNRSTTPADDVARLLKRASSNLDSTDVPPAHEAITMLRELDELDPAAGTTWWREVDSARDLSEAELARLRSNLFAPSRSDQQAIVRAYLRGDLDSLIGRSLRASEQARSTVPPPSPAWSSGGETLWNRLGLLADLPDQVARDRVRVLTTLADDVQSLAKVFDATLGDGQLRSVRRSMEKLARHSPVDELQSRAHALSSSTTSGEHEVVVVIGHSDDLTGETLRLADGSTITSTELHKAAALANRRCIVVTCHSRDLGIGFKIGSNDAADAVARALEAAGDGVDVDVFVKALRDDLVKKRRVRFGLSVTTTGGGAGLGAAWIASERYEEEDSE